MDAAVETSATLGKISTLLRARAAADLRSASTVTALVEKGMQSSSGPGSLENSGHGKAVTATSADKSDDLLVRFHCQIYRQDSRIPPTNGDAVECVNCPTCTPGLGHVEA